MLCDKVIFTLAHWFLILAYILHSYTCFELLTNIDIQTVSQTSEIKPLDETRASAESKERELRTIETNSKVICAEFIKIVSFSFWGEWKLILKLGKCVYMWSLFILVCRISFCVCHLLLDTLWESKSSIWMVFKEPFMVTYLSNKHMPQWLPWSLNAPGNI